jgi:hypothetical protein
MSGYIGNIPVPQATQTRQSFTATASQTTFNTAGYTAGFIDVFLNGIKLVDGTDYTATNGSDVVLTTGAALDDVLDVVAYTAFDVANNTLTDATINNTLTLKNATEEDTDGGRESKITFKGEQSGGEITTLAQIQASHDGTADDEKGDLIFSTNDGSDGNTPTERLRIDSAGNVGIGGAASSFGSGVATLQLKGLASGKTAAVTFRDNGGTDVASIFAQNDATYGLSIGTLGATGDFVRFHTGALGTERMRIDSSGNLLVGKTVQGLTNAGFEVAPSGQASATQSGASALRLNRLSSDGEIVQFRKNGTTQGVIQVTNNRIAIASGNSGMFFDGGSSVAIWPWKETAVGSGDADNSIDLGDASNRWDDIYATNGTIQTSDQNEKQQIASLTDAEMTAAKAISKLFKTFKWNDSVAEKGDAARTHSGVIAQDVEQAMTDAGLNAGDYAFFISTTWWETQTEVPAVEADEENGVEAQEAYTRTDTYDTAEEAPEGATERNRKGIRYPQLLSFIGAATEQRLASIESRLDALENPA